jgi:hypothetical protein
MEQLTLDGGAVPLCTASADDLLRWCRLANIVAFEMLGYRNSCILTSHALAAFLHLKGLDAEPFRAEVHVHHLTDRTVSGCGLGGDGDGTRRPAADPGSWRGHLAVTCDGYVLDPTIDQANVGGERIRPAVFAMPLGWEDGKSHRWTEGDLQVSHQRYHRQVGWKSAQAARPVHWRDVLTVMRNSEQYGDW